MSDRLAPRAATPVVGADGGPGGWVCVSSEGEGLDLRAFIVRSSEELLAIDPRYEVIAVDIPIGLPDSGLRPCDEECKALIGPARARSVFPAPIRPAMLAPTQTAAQAINRAINKRGIAPRAWSIYHRTLTLDRVITPETQGRVREIHPELCFWAWNGRAVLEHSKHTSDGLAQRRRLVESTYGEEAWPSARASLATSDAADDDLLDAFAAHWTARRIADGTARSIPEVVERDRLGLRMEMWY